MKRTFSILLIGLLLALTCPPFSFLGQTASQTTPESGTIESRERGIVALAQTLREMTNPYTVLCVAAHPADADFATLAYYHHKFGARVAVVIVTRGKGQDAEAQTRETLQRAFAVGADTYFLNLPDSGYAKSAEEALRQWGRDLLL